MQIPSLRNAQGERLACSFLPGAAGRRDLLVLGHGLTSDRDRPWSVALGTALQAHGIATLRLSFSGNGESEGRFEDSTASKEVGDLAAVLDALVAAGWRVGYVGHSLGGAVGVMQAARDSRLALLVCLAGIAHPAEFMQRLFGKLRLGDALLGKAHCPLGAALRDDLLGLGSIVDRATRVTAPWLLVHGTADEVVPVTHARDLAAAAGGRAGLVELPGVDHSFSGDGLHAMLAAVVPWVVARMAAAAPGT